jgi:hypothetical protein
MENENGGFFSMAGAKGSRADIVNLIHAKLTSPEGLEASC